MNADLRRVPSLDQLVGDPTTATALTPAERNACVLKCSAVLAALAAVTADTTARSAGEKESPDDRSTRRSVSIMAMNATVLLINVSSIAIPMGTARSEFARHLAAEEAANDVESVEKAVTSPKGA